MVSTIEKRPNTYLMNGQLVNIDTVIPIKDTANILVISIARYGRAASIAISGHGLITLGNGEKLPFGTDGGTITLTGNDTNGFKITSSISNLPNFYLTIVELSP